MSDRKRWRLLLLAMALTMTGSTAQAGQRMTTSCGKRLSDGDIHVFDILPDRVSGFKVLRFKANHTKDGWSLGSCVIETRP